jgi:hypothetical protein
MNPKDHGRQLVGGAVGEGVWGGEEVGIGLSYMKPASGRCWFYFLIKDSSR